MDRRGARRWHLRRKAGRRRYLNRQREGRRLPVTVHLYHSSRGPSSQLANAILPPYLRHVAMTSLPTPTQATPPSPRDQLRQVSIPRHTHSSAQLFDARSILATLRVCPWNLTATPASSMSEIAAGLCHFGAPLRERGRVPAFPSVHLEACFCASIGLGLLVEISFSSAYCAILRNFHFRANSPEIDVFPAHHKSSWPSCRRDMSAGFDSETP